MVVLGFEPRSRPNLGLTGYKSAALAVELYYQIFLTDYLVDIGKEPYDLRFYFGSNLV